MKKTFSEAKLVSLSVSQFLRDSQLGLRPDLAEVGL